MPVPGSGRQVAGMSEEQLEGLCRAHFSVAWTREKTEDTLPEQDVTSNSTLYWAGLKPVEVSATSIITEGDLYLFRELPPIYIVSEG